MEARKKQEEED